MKIFLTIILVLTFVCVGFGQEPNQWKGITLDETTADEVIAKLGAPKKDQIGKMKIPVVSPLLRKDLQDEKKWRTMHYKQIENTKNGLFLFDENNKLVFIQFEVKDMSPQAFVSAYDLSFKPVFSAMDQAFTPKDFARDGSGNVYAKSYPTVYYLVAQSDKSYVLAMVANVPSFGGAFKRSMGIPDSGVGYPGKIALVELVSRSLEDKSGQSDLK